MHHKTLWFMLHEMQMAMMVPIPYVAEASSFFMLAPSKCSPCANDSDYESQNQSNRLAHFNDGFGTFVHK